MGATRRSPLAGTSSPDWEQQGTGALRTSSSTAKRTPRVMRLAVPGRHMALNALGALLAAVEIGARPDTVLDGLCRF